MEKLPCSECKGLCCGPVPVKLQELKQIKKAVKAMPTARRMELENQVRYYGTCIFFDLDRDRCGIYSARPEICRVFGHYKNLVCFRKPEAAINANWVARENHVGVLSEDFTWKDFK
jgi:Fe-S-cluster containining protein